MRYLVLVALSCINIDVFAWGFYGHKLINRNAVFLLPPELIAFFKPNIHYLSEHAVDPDKRRYVLKEEGSRHYIDMDLYDSEWLRSNRVTWKMACDKYSEDTLLARGIVPWWIQKTLGALTDAFREKDRKKILKLSADLGHYIADAHVPLHASSNHNGQKTGQHGIHGFWESRIPELFAESDWDLWTGRAVYIRSPLEVTWQFVFESAAAADTVLTTEKQLNNRFPQKLKYAYENRNGMLQRQYSTAYSKQYNELLRGMVERRLYQSIHAVASFWYTAWVNAGQPNCSDLTTSQFDESEEKEMEELNHKWRAGAVYGKSCE